MLDTSKVMLAACSCDPGNGPFGAARPKQLDQALEAIAGRLIAVATCAMHSKAGFSDMRPARLLGSVALGRNGTRCD